MWAASLGCAGEMEMVIVLDVLILQWVELRCSLQCLICKAVWRTCANVAELDSMVAKGHGLILILVCHIPWSHERHSLIKHK
jgi:hypothetical protein